MCGHDNVRSSRGFTLVESMAVLAAMIPILIAILSTTTVVERSTDTNIRRSDIMTQHRKLADRLTQLLRPALTSSLRVRATQVDVDELQAIEAARMAANPLATPHPIPNVGDWIVPPGPITSRPGIRFQEAVGPISLVPDATTPPSTIERFLDPAETANGTDDDGDGLIDEGTLRGTMGDRGFALALDVEGISFTLNGKVLEVAVVLARKDQSRNVLRSTFRHSIWLRNN